MRTRNLFTLTWVLLLAACSKDRPSPAPVAAAPSVAASASASASAQARPAPPARPQLARPYNVLLIVIEALRADMPWAGYPRDIAPWLTAFQAKHCVTYTRAYALSSYTAKSVVPALVGAYPSEMPRDGYFFTKYADENLFVTERIQQLGHRTFQGQAHGYFLPMLKTNQGFDETRLLDGVSLKAVEGVVDDRLFTLAKQMLSDPANVAPPGGKRFFGYFHFMDPHHTYVKHADHRACCWSPR